MSSHDHFSLQATEYARFRPTYPAVLYDWLCDQSAQRGVAWDCGCGSGQATVGLAEWFAEVIGTDLSASQIAQAPVIPNVRWKVCRAEESGLASQSVDLITVAQALHWFDLTVFWQEVRRILKPGGLVAVWSYGRFQIADREVQSICDHFYDEVVGEFWPKERKIVEAGYDALTFPFDELSPHPMEIVAAWSLGELLGYFSTWSATVCCAQTKGSSPIPDLAEKLRQSWREGERRVRWPISIRVGRV
ncbi:MAG: class I SAM-dependent methyltransferase [Verrucomicrobiaceae bacterium]|nr:class I SAM-dependent methyltransferase [Verrucomicrobiaceae bacterium]